MRPRVGRIAFCFQQPSGGSNGFPHVSLSLACNSQEFNRLVVSSSMRVNDRLFSRFDLVMLPLYFKYLHDFTRRGSIPRLISSRLHIRLWLVHKKLMLWVMILPAVKLITYSGNPIPNKNTEYCNVMMRWRLLFGTVDETCLICLSSILCLEPPKGMSCSMKTSVMLLPLTTLTGK